MNREEAAVRGLPPASSISAAELAQAFPAAPRPQSSPWALGPGRWEAGGETGRGAGEKAARCGAKVTRTPGRQGLLVLGPKDGAKAWRVPPDPRQERWIHSVQTFRGTKLGRRGSLGQPRGVRAVPEGMPTPLRSRRGVMERHVSG